MNIIKKLLLISTFFLLGNSILRAQPLPGDPGSTPENPVPITGIEYLIAAGAAFGAKKIYDKRKSK